MAFSTAFQRGAFQVGAFQINVTPDDEDTTTPRGRLRVEATTTRPTEQWRGQVPRPRPT